MSNQKSSVDRHNSRQPQVWKKREREEAENAAEDLAE